MKNLHIYSLGFRISNLGFPRAEREAGVVLIIALLSLGILLLLGSYFLTFTLTESRISKSQERGVRTYYLAEAGINEAIWKLKNDALWKNSFESEDLNPDPEGKYWSASFSRTGLGGFYDVAIQNSARARGQIIATSTISLAGGKTSQRVVKTAVFKALASPTEDSGVFSGGSSENVDINYTFLRINDGNLFSNHNLDIKGGSIVEVYNNPDTSSVLEGQVLVNGILTIKDSTLNECENKCAKNECVRCSNHPAGKPCKSCPSDPAGVPLVDFDSDGQYSFKSRAQAAEDLGQCQILCNGVQCDNRCVLEDEDFEDLLWQVGQGGTLTLNNKITYVEGSIELKGGRHLIVNGALVADDNVAIGERYKWGGDRGFSQITINRPSQTSPSGLLTKRKIDFGQYSSFQDINITGVIYANDEIRLISLPKTFNVLGGVIARKLALTSLWQWLDITLDNQIILYGLGYKIDHQAVRPVYSPIITIEHWEESY